MPRKKKTNAQTKPVESLKHKDKRTNIPTEELRDFVKEDEDKPQTILYPRDPSLDPQLVWQGKDEQDREDLAVPAAPIYIQEKIHPQAVIEDVRREAKKETEPQLDLFADFNGIEFEDLIDFYRHKSNWSNRMILGDSLHVMTSLAEKEGLKGQVQMIYLDPPYGIKFGSNWQVSTRKRVVRDGKAADTTRQPEQVKAFRDTWELGIHSYLSYLRDRLIVARELLTGTGSVFVQIGDENIHLVRCLLDEVFGTANFCSQIIFKKTGFASAQLLPTTGDYVLWYAKDKEQIKYRDILLERPLTVEVFQFYDHIELPDGQRRAIDSNEREGNKRIPKDARLFARNPFVSPGASREPQPFEFRKHTYLPPSNRHWATPPAGLKRADVAGRITKKGKTLRFVRFFDDYPCVPLSNVWQDTGMGGFVGDPRIYVVQTETRALQRCLLMATDPGDLVLDPTCGSGTTAYVAEKWGRRWITIDTSRVALALARTRLMAAKYPYYLLADSPEGVKKEAEITGKFPPDYKTGSDIRKGFVYERVPHITLKAIANNTEIDTIHAKWQKHLEPVRQELNKLLKKEWEKWEVPREPDDKWPKKAKDLLEKWWDLGRKRQKEIDRSITRSADQEILFDQPYEDKKRIRVSGGFTVESLSPHRILAADQDLPESEQEARRSSGPGQFETMILENLKKAGVQNTFKNERLKFNRLEPFAGTWIQAEGEYTENDGTIRRAAVSIGPEHGTAGPQLVKEAAKEAVKGVGFDMLIICGFAFDPHVSEEARRYGRLTILPCRMNNDLAMGDELLKKTGAGNLFMVFGEPDIAIQKTKDSQFTIEINGLDIYDPTTGEIRGNSTDDIACWFIDTNYNEESFFVRHAYFTGGDKPYDQLKRALKAEVDEAAWSALYSSKSRPFDPPETGKIAVKVINHYGDEVLKVYDIYPE